MARNRCRRPTDSKFGGPVKRGDPGSDKAARSPSPPVNRKGELVPFSVQDPASKFQETQDPHSKKVNRRRVIRRMSREKTQESNLKKNRNRAKSVS